MEVNSPISSNRWHMGWEFIATFQLWIQCSIFWVGLNNHQVIPTMWTLLDRNWNRTRQCLKLYTLGITQISQNKVWGHSTIKKINLNLIKLKWEFTLMKLFHWRLLSIKEGYKTTRRRLNKKLRIKSRRWRNLWMCKKRIKNHCLISLQMFYFRSATVCLIKRILPYRIAMFRWLQDLPL